MYFLRSLTRQFTVVMKSEQHFEKICTLHTYLSTYSHICGPKLLDQLCSNNFILCQPNFKMLLLGLQLVKKWWADHLFLV